MHPAHQLSPGLVSITFRSLTPAAIIELAQKAGLHAIEWGGDIHVPPGDVAKAREVARQTTGAGLRVSSYGSYYRAGADPDSFRAILESARALAAPRIRVWAGQQDASKTAPGDRAAITADLRRIARLAAGEGIRIALEFHGGTLTSEARSAAALFTDLAGEAVDAYWQPRVGASVPEALSDIAILSPWLCHAHVFQWNGIPDRFPLEDGAHAWPAYLHALSQLSRPVEVQLEYVRQDDPEQLLCDAACLRCWLATMNDA